MTVIDCQCLTIFCHINFLKLMNHIHPINPTSHFCFNNASSNLGESTRAYRRNHDQIEKSETTIIGYKPLLSGESILYSYYISEASNEIKSKSDFNPFQFPSSGIINSIYSVYNSNYLVLIRSPQSDQIRYCSYSPENCIIQSPGNPIVQQNNQKISFFFPILSESKYDSVIYAVGNELIEIKTERPRSICPPQKNHINCADYIDHNVFAIGVESSLLLYDSRSKKLIANCPMHYGDISAISANEIDRNILYTGGYDGVVKQIDFRNITNDNKNEIPVLCEVLTGSPRLPQCKVVAISSNPIDKNVFATAASGNIDYGYVKIFKDDVCKYSSKPLNNNLNNQQKEESVFIEAATANKAIWINWSNKDPSLLVSEDMNYVYRTHYFDDLNFDDILSDL